MITLHKDWKTYYSRVCDRCHELIYSRIWTGIDIVKLDIWLRNFQTDEEKYFCARILDSLIYRPNSQTYSLINEVLYKNLNNTFRILQKDSLQCFPSCLYESHIDKLVRLVPVITKSCPVTKSSNEILRFMKRYFGVSEDWIINPWNIKDEIEKGVTTFIFIDDFLGTGSQFRCAVRDSQLEQYMNANTFVYAPLVAHSKGLDSLKGDFPHLKMTYSEKLDNTHSFFCNYFSDQIDEAKSYYLSLLDNRQISYLEESQFGFGNLELTFAFEHAAPDNSLHILYKSSEFWKPLFNH